MPSPNKRNITIDMLRGFSILVMIFIHVSAFYQSPRWIRIAWDYTHFAVPVFVFCSAFLYFKKNKEILSLSEFVPYIKKRVLRLIIPFYIFFTVLLGFMLVLDPEAITFRYISQTMLLLGGKNESWLVLLFISIMIVLPFLSFLGRRLKLGLGLFACACIGSAVLFLVTSYPFPYRTIMWLPWSAILLYAWPLAINPHPNRFAAYSAGVFGLIFILSRWYLTGVEASTIFTSNKYPPNLYYLSYGLFMITLLFLFFENVDIPYIIEKVIQFFSLHSYSLFFVHTVIIYAGNQIIGKGTAPFWLNFFIVLVLSVVVQMGINRLSLVFARKKETPGS